MSRKASVFFILVLSFPIMRTFHNNLNWNDNINETLGEHTNIWGIERSGFFNGREKWAKGFENQRV